MYIFTERVRAILVKARDEALALRHEYVGTEHLLLAVAEDEQGVAAAVLTNLLIDPASLRNFVLGMAKPGSGRNASQSDLPYTSRGKKVLELALTEARELGHSYVGAEHLLLGLLRESKGIAAQALAERGLTYQAARAETMRLLGDAAPLQPRVDRPKTYRRAVATTLALPVAITALAIAIAALVVALLR